MLQVANSHSPVTQLNVTSVQMQVRFVREQPLASRPDFTQGGYEVEGPSVSIITSRRDEEIRGHTPQGGKGANIESLVSATEALEVGVWAVARAMKMANTREVNDSIMIVMNGFV